MTAALHAQMAHDLTWATGGSRHAGVVRALIEEHQIRSVLDFGCGRGTLGNHVMGRDKHLKPLAIRWVDYDPAIPGKDVLPDDHVDMVVSTHSLEHVEPDHLEATLIELMLLTPRVVYAAIPSGPATKKFAGTDRDLHLIQQPPWWWRKQLERFGEVRLLPQSTNRLGQPRDESRFVVIAQ